MRAYDALDLLQCDFRDDVSTAYINRVMCYLQVRSLNIDSHEHLQFCCKVTGVRTCHGRHQIGKYTGCVEPACLELACATFVSEQGIVNLKVI